MAYFKGKTTMQMVTLFFSYAWRSFNWWSRK